MLLYYCKHWKEKGHKTKQVILFFSFKVNVTKHFNFLKKDKTLFSLIQLKI